MSDQNPTPKPASLEQTQSRLLEVEARVMAIQRFVTKGNPAIFTEIEGMKKTIHDILLRKLENSSPEIAANLDKRKPHDLE